VNARKYLIVHQIPNIPPSVWSVFLEKFIEKILLLINSCACEIKFGMKGFAIMWQLCGILQPVFDGSMRICGNPASQLLKMKSRHCKRNA
jgi:hypothetical protein